MLFASGCTSQVTNTCRNEQISMGRRVREGGEGRGGEGREERGGEGRGEEEGKRGERKGKEGGGIRK